MDRNCLSFNIVGFLNEPQTYKPKRQFKIQGSPNAYNHSDYNTSLERFQQSNAFYTGNPIRMGGENTAIEYMRDQQILNLFFVLQVDKSPLVVIPPALPRSRTNKIYDYALAVILLIGGIWGAIYLLN